MNKIISIIYKINLIILTKRNKFVTDGLMVYCKSMIQDIHALTDFKGMRQLKLYQHLSSAYLFCVSQF